MIVFSNYFKIARNYLGLIIMFSAISIGISIANTSYSNGEEDYVNINPKLAVINYDSSMLIDNFIKYMDEFSEFKDVNDNKKDIQDALYNNKVDAVLIIPENFTKDFLEGREPDIEIKKSLKNVSEYTQILVNRYFKIANIYAKAGMDENGIILSIKDDLEKEIEVKVVNEKKGDIEKLAIYYSFENYAFLAIFIFVIGTIMCIFNKEVILKRNFVSSMERAEFSKQLFLGNICLTLCLWLIFIVVSVFIYKDLMFNMNGLLLIINSLVFVFTATSLAYLIGNLIKNQNVISGIQNVVSLGLSFISGCFVPIEWLDKNIVNFSKLFPSYWFIDNNYKIVELSTFDLVNLKQVIINMVIVFGFGIVYYAISRVIISKRNT